MSNLQIYENKSLKTIDRDVAAVGLRGVIVEAFAYMQQFPAGESKDDQRQTIDMQMKFLLDDIKSLHHGVDLVMVRTAFRNGLRKVYGEFYGLNNKTYAEWINAAVKAEREAKQRDQKALPAAQTEKVLSKEEKEKIFQEALKFCEDTFTSTGKVIDTGGAIFDQLWRRGIVKLNSEQVTEYKNRASQIMYASLESDRMKAVTNIDRSKIQQIDIQMSQIMDENSSLVSIEAKRLALTDYFKSLTKEEEA